MSHHDVLELVCARGVLPAVVAEDVDIALPLGAALKAGGLPIAEVTLRTAAALEVLTGLAADEELLVGAGTVTRPEQVDLVQRAGARFVIMPGFSAPVVDRCHELGMAVIPGVCTATEVIAALDHGCQLLKFFPAEAGGGTATIRALHGPFPDVRFIPTGGVSLVNAADYLSLPSVAAVGGSWIVQPSLISPGDFATVRRLAGQAVQLAAQVRS